MRERREKVSTSETSFNTSTDLCFRGLQAFFRDCFYSPWRPIPAYKKPCTSGTPQQKESFFFSCFTRFVLEGHRRSCGRATSDARAGDTSGKIYFQPLYPLRLFCFLLSLSLSLSLSRSYIHQIRFLLNSRKKKKKREREREKKKRVPEFCWIFFKVSVD